MLPISIDELAGAISQKEAHPSAWPLEAGITAKNGWWRDPAICSMCAPSASRDGNGPYRKYAQDLSPDCAAFQSSAEWREAKAGHLPSDATLFCALTLDPALEAMTGVKDALNGATDFYQDLQALLPMPRRLFDRVRQVVAAQRRFRTGRESTLTRRDFYEDARDLFVLDGSRVRPPKESARRAIDGV